MSPSAVHRIPVEIWTHILDLAIGEASLPPPPDKTIVEDLRFFQSRKEPMNVRAYRETRKAELSLVCRLFHTILRGLPSASTEDSVTYRYNYRRRGDPRSLFGMRTLYISHDRDGLPLEWYAKKWSSIEVVYTTVRLMDDVIRLLSHTPNVKALFCERLHSWAYCRVAAITRLLSSDVGQRLTHLSIYIPYDQVLDPLKLPSLRFLELDIDMYWVKTTTARQYGEALPWTCHNLRSLSIKGSMSKAVFDLLIPFFRRHATSVKDLLDRLEENYDRSCLLQYFQNVETYGANGSRLQISSRPREVHASPDSRSITFLMMTPLDHFELGANELQLEAHVRGFTSPGSPYVVAKLMVNTSWETLKDWLSSFAIVSSVGMSLSRLDNIASKGVPLVDWDGVAYQTAKQRNMSTVPE